MQPSRNQCNLIMKIGRITPSRSGSTKLNILRVPATLYAKLRSNLPLLTNRNKF